MYRSLFKPIIDLIVSFLSLLLLMPIILIITILLFITNNGKSFFIHERAGKNAKRFHLYKFRTMNNNQDAEGKLLPDKDRMTKIGKFIRSTSLDELPQLLNVFFGQMSLIGPRPLPVKYLGRYSKDQARRHDVKPGITGWAQINGRNSITWDKKFDFDVYYVENYSFILDSKIMLLTLKKVLMRQGINSNTTVTMEEFKGSSTHIG